MEENDYDEACRYLLKKARGLMMYWFLRRGESHVRFDSFIDSVLTLPGGKERICDAVACMSDLDHKGMPVAAIVEFQLAPDAKMFGRLLLAGGICWLTIKPTDLPGDRFQLTAVVINLTGVGDCANEMVVGDGVWTIKPHERNLSTYDAGAVLADILAGTAPRQALAFIPLMKNATDPANMQTWSDIASADADPDRRSDYALAVVFAGAVGGQETWRGMVERLKMNESPVAREWRAEARREGLSEGERKGKIEGKIDLLIVALEERFGNLPVELAAQVRGSTDSAQIDRWMRSAVAVSVNTLDLFRQKTGL